MPTIAIDAMGGDFAPGEVVRAAGRISLDSEIRCVLVGEQPILERVLARCPHRREPLSIVHAGSAIGMAEEPAAALRDKLDCSLLVAAGLVAAGDADAMVSAGNTGACVLACAATFRRIRGVHRTALASVFPRRIDEPGQDPLGLLLDVGATVRCDSRDLVQFALMGAAYAERISKRPRPRVALLNMGSEPTKGGATLVEAHRRLAAIDGLDFVGNVEGSDLARGRADVVVCEGLVGNVTLKLIEGVAEVALDMAGAAARESWRWRLGLGLLAGGIRRLRDLTDYANYGGSPILGFESMFIKAHGRSNAKAIANAIKVAAKAVRDGVPGEIGARLAAAAAAAEPGPPQGGAT